MKIKKINKLWYVMFIVGLSLFAAGYLFKSGVEREAWFKYALKFDQARCELIANDLAGKKSAIKDLTKMDKIKQRFLQTRQPTEEEIISVLSSQDRKFQRVGLIAMSLKPVETDKVAEILFGFLQDKDSEIRGFALSSLRDFAKFPESKKADFGKQLLEIARKEKDSGPLIDEFLLLSKFPSEEAARFLTEQLTKEGKENRMARYFAFQALRDMGNPFYNEAAEYIKKHGSPEITQEFLEWEKYGADSTGKEQKCF